jgi:hypothetical protein
VERCVPRGRCLASLSAAPLFGFLLLQASLTRRGPGSPGRPLVALPSRSSSAPGVQHWSRRLAYSVFPTGSPGAPSPGRRPARGFEPFGELPLRRGSLLPGTIPRPPNEADIEQEPYQVADPRPAWTSDFAPRKSVRSGLCVTLWSTCGSVVERGGGRSAAVRIRGKRPLLESLRGTRCERIAHRVAVEKTRKSIAFRSTAR